MCILGTYTRPAWFSIPEVYVLANSVKYWSEIETSFYHLFKITIMYTCKYVDKTENGQM